MLSIFCKSESGSSVEDTGIAVSDINLLITIS